MVAHICPSFREQTLELLGYSLRRDHCIGHERGNQTVGGVEDSIDGYSRNILYRVVSKMRIDWYS
jgi:hypothetical protein